MTATATATQTVTQTAGSSASTEPGGSESAGQNGVGKRYRNRGAVVTIVRAKTAASIAKGGRTIAAGAGAKYVILRARVLDDAKTSFDLTCGLPIVNYLLDDQGRQYDAIENLYEIPGNRALDPARVQTIGDAHALVREYQNTNSYVLRPRQADQMTEDELRRAWGTEMLRGMGLTPEGPV